MPAKLTRYQITILRAVAAGQVSKPNRIAASWWIVDPARSSGFRPLGTSMNVLRADGLIEDGERGPRYTPAVLTAKGRAVLDELDQS